MHEPSETSRQMWVRRAVAVTFVGAGVLKLAVLPLVRTLRPDLGLPSFGEILATLELPVMGRLPAPTLLAWVVGGVEIGGGAALLARRRIKLVCAAFAADMVGALASLSIPAAFGRGPVIGEHRLGAEPWRIPLELALLGGVIWLGRLWERRLRSKGASTTTA